VALRQIAERTRQHRAQRPGQVRGRTRPRVPWTPARTLTDGAGTSLAQTSRMPSRDPRGFTLVEVLMVVVIIGVIAGIAIAQYQSFRSHGFDAKVASAVRHVATGQEAYYVDHFTYTTKPADLPGIAVDDVSIQITPGNSGDLATSFRVLGTHPAADRSYLWVSDPLPGQPHLIEN
jgi:type IV pilus assembly protein PilA